MRGGKLPEDSRHAMEIRDQRIAEKNNTKPVGYIPPSDDGWLERATKEDNASGVLEVDNEKETVDAEAS